MSPSFSISTLLVPGPPQSLVDSSSWCCETSPWVLLPSQTLAPGCHNLHRVDMWWHRGKCQPRRRSTPCSLCSAPGELGGTGSSKLGFLKSWRIPSRHHRFQVTTVSHGPPWPWIILGYPHDLGNLQIWILRCNPIQSPSKSPLNQH